MTPCNNLPGLTIRRAMAVNEFISVGLQISSFSPVVPLCPACVCVLQCVRVRLGLTGPQKENHSERGLELPRGGRQQKAAERQLSFGYAAGRRKKKIKKKNKERIAYQCDRHTHSTKLTRSLLCLRL